MQRIFLIALGGALGSVLRAGVQALGWKMTMHKFPLGTICANVIGAFLIAFLATWAGGKLLAHREWSTFLFVGVLGGFTTFSALIWESCSLAHTEFRLLAWYVSAHIVLGVAALLSGVWLGSRV